MGRTFRIGTVAGAPVRVSAWWFVVAALLTVWVAPVYENWLPDLGRNGEYLLGAVFVALLYVSAFLHELGHAFTAKAFGLRVHSIELTALGGLTQMDAPQTPGRSAATSAAGPAVNAVLVVVGIGALQFTTDQTLPHLFAAQLAWTNGLLAAFNLLPGLPLDGGSILRAGVWRLTGRLSTATVAAAWSGRVVAAGAGLWFLRGVVSSGSGGVFDGLLLLLVAIWMWTTSTAILDAERARAAVPSLDARLMARRTIKVGADLPVSVVMAQLAEAKARAALVTDSAGHVTGIVSEAAVAAAPRERWPWITASDVSRRMGPELRVDAELTGQRLMEVLAATPATEYLVVDGADEVVGVLAFSDVEAVLTRR